MCRRRCGTTGCIEDAEYLCQNPPPTFDKRPPNKDLSLTSTSTVPWLLLPSFRPIAPIIRAPVNRRRSVPLRNPVNRQFPTLALRGGDRPLAGTPKLDSLAPREQMVSPRQITLDPPPIPDARRSNGVEGGLEEMKLGVVDVAVDSVTGNTLSQGSA